MIANTYVCTGVHEQNCLAFGIPGMQHELLEIPKRKINQRNGACACVLGVDIGAYDTCGHLCKYCYANADVNLVKENRKKHNPKSPFLIGESMSGDVIHEAEQKNWIDRQLRFDFF